MARRALVDKSF